MAPPLLVAAVRAELRGLDGEALGVGMVAAAAEMACLIAIRRPDAVLLLGTAGAYPGGPEPGTIVTARRISLGSGTAATGHGYVPLAPAPVVAVPFEGLPAFDVLSCIAITTDPALAARLGEGAQVEHMEAFGMAWACARAGIPMGVVLGITNRVGPDAHAEWKARRDEVERAVADRVRGR